MITENERPRNWRNNPNLGMANRSRSQSISDIEALVSGFVGPDTAAQFGQLQALVHPTAEGSDPNYRWSFYSEDGYRGLEFHRSPGYEQADHVVHWVSFVICLVKAAVASASSTELQSYSASQMGLFQFLLA